MKLSDLRRAIDHLIEQEGDLPVLELRQVWYDSFEFCKDGIDINARLVELAAYHRGDRHCIELSKHVNQDAKDRREFKAFKI